MSNSVVKSLCLASLVFGYAANLRAGPSSSDGGYGGYVGSSRQMQMMRESAQQRGNLERSLGRGDSASGGASGVQVELHIHFPASQKGLANIQLVTLQPTDGNSHLATALATVDRANNAITATFGPKKDVQGGHSYRVVVEDARGGKYPVGTISIDSSKAPLALNISAPLLGGSDSAGSTAANTSAPRSDAGAGSGAAAPSTGAGYVAPKVGAGYVAPSIGKGYVRPGTADR